LFFLTSIDLKKKRGYLFSENVSCLHPEHILYFYLYYKQTSSLKAFLKISFKSIKVARGIKESSLWSALKSIPQYIQINMPKLTIIRPTRHVGNPSGAL
jgi:hypothetical protein